MNTFKKTASRVALISILAAVPVIGHAYPANPEECKAAEGRWIDFETTPPDGWCRDAKPTLLGPVLVCALVKGIERKIDSEMVCFPRDAARLKLLLEHDVPANTNGNKESKVDTKPKSNSSTSQSYYQTSM
ncbi:MAG: hypothetical protein WAT12_16675 [Candidatus Nitrotoga sp.]